jgi:hypothetical protein
MKNGQAISQQELEECFLLFNPNDGTELEFTKNQWVNVNKIYYNFRHSLIL